MTSQYLEWASSGSTPTAGPVPTPRPAVTRYLWSTMSNPTTPTQDPGRGGTPRLTYQAESAYSSSGASARHSSSPIVTSTASPSLAARSPTVPRSVTPLKRAPEMAPSYPAVGWPYQSVPPTLQPSIGGGMNVYYHRQSSETVPSPQLHTSYESQPFPHYRAHTPPPTYHSGYTPHVTYSPSASDSTAVFGYRALNLPPRSVTPPPTPSYMHTTTTHHIDPFVSISDMSPFMILRIKALMELASVPSYTEEPVGRLVAWVAHTGVTHTYTHTSHRL
eukprot:Blabericola_migrator_1__6824@NODE_3458_length_1759_cov_306_238180_g2151_i0_p1_GENE_NODE_3458_length_1759_cov_306_238180_g2151_i0NODE_3458_length_1759_cov_306_238180_g2151_i0_p1_ORF_typecomplete_len276_score21_74DUF1582/PF07621_11/0_2_NODE_3458_length_1759_cov_306_238180_g2151_i04111238